MSFLYGHLVLIFQCTQKNDPQYFDLIITILAQNIFINIYKIN